jgi:hypothetical protein
MDQALAERAWYLTHCGLLARDVARKLDVPVPRVFELLDAHAPVAKQREERLAKGVDGLVTRNRPGPRERVEPEKPRSPMPRTPPGIQTQAIANIDNIEASVGELARDPIPAPKAMVTVPVPVSVRPGERWRIGPKGAAAMAASLGVPEADVIAAIRAHAISVTKGF